MLKQNVLFTKAIAVLAFVIGMLSVSLNAQTASDLFISEYCEGSSYNKYIEIYNGTGSDLDLSDYSVRNYYSSTGYNQINLSGILSSGDVFVVAHSSAWNEILNKADLTTGSASWNGDDAIILYKNSNPIDIIGDIADAGGNDWDVAGLYRSGSNQTWIRKPSVTDPNTDWNASAGMNGFDSEWIVKEENYFENIGTHNMTGKVQEMIINQSFDAGFGLWTTYSVSSNEDWYLQYGEARINGYGQDEASEDWLISEPMNLNNYMNETFTFFSQWRYGDQDTDDYLKVMYSTDYSGTGNPNNANWNELPFEFATEDQSWTQSVVDLSEINGQNVYIAFKYYSADSPRRWYIESASVQGDFFSTTGKTAYLMVNKVTPAVPIAGIPFTIEVYSTDINGVPVAVSDDAVVDLVQIGGDESLQGDLQKTLKAGQYKVVFDNLTHPIKDVVMVRPTAPNNDENDTDELQPKRFQFDVSSKPELVISTYEKGHVGSTHPVIRVEARNEDGTPNVYYSGYDVELMINNGMYSGSTMGQAYFGVIEFDNIVFEDAANYQLVAMADQLTDSDSKMVDVNPAPYFEEIIVPEFVKGEGDFFENGDGNGRMPSYALVKFNNLHPNTTYRFTTGAMAPEDVYPIGEGGEYGENELTADPDGWDPGLNIHYNMDEGTYEFYSYPALDRERQFSQFTTGDETEKTFWVNLIPTNDNSGIFNAGEDIHWIVDLGFETGDLVVRRATQTSSRNLRLSVFDGEGGMNTASGFYDNDARMMPMNKVVLRDNNGNVVSTAMVEDDGAILQNPGFTHQSPYFYQNVEGVRGAFATFVPNSFAGIFQIDEYDNMGNVVKTWTDLDGEWATVSTVGDGETIDFETPRLMVYNLNDIVCAGIEPTTLAWSSYGVENVDIAISVNGSGFDYIYENVPARDGNFDWDIIREIFSTDEIVNRDIELMISSSEHSYINDNTNEFKIYDAPIIDDQSEYAVICKDYNIIDENDHVTLGIVATGSFLNYQWYKDGVMIPDANNATYVITDAEFRNSARYSCELTTGESECASVWSEDIPVYVALHSEITSQPVDRGATQGGYASFRVKGHINGVDPNYEIAVQWFKVAEPVDIPLVDGAHIEGAQSSLLTFVNIQPEHFGQYYAVVEGKCDYPEIQSDIAELIEVAIDISGPEGVDACAGDEITLTVDASVPGDETLAYQWQKDGENLMDDARITGAMASTLAITDVNPTDAGSYSCVVTAVESNVSTESEMAEVMVGIVPEITDQSQTQNIEPGTTVALFVNANGNDLSYTWTKDGEEIQTGSAPEYEIMEATPEDEGDYVCTVTNDCGEDVSETITITVNDGGVSSVSEVSGNGYSLGTSVPSPVQSNAVVNYFVPAPTKVEITLRDMRGKQLAVLVNEFVAQGSHEFTLNADMIDLPAGTYFYTMHTNDVTLTNSLVIVK